MGVMAGAGGVFVKEIMGGALGSVIGATGATGATGVGVLTGDGLDEGVGGTGKGDGLGEGGTFVFAPPVPEGTLDGNAPVAESVGACVGAKVGEG